MPCPCLEDPRRGPGLRARRRGVDPPLGRRSQRQWPRPPTPMCPPCRPLGEEVRSPLRGACSTTQLCGSGRPLLSAGATGIESTPGTELMRQASPPGRPPAGGPPCSTRVRSSWQVGDPTGPLGGCWGSFHHASPSTLADRLTPSGRPEDVPLDEGRQGLSDGPGVKLLSWSGWSWWVVRSGHSTPIRGSGGRRHSSVTISTHGRGKSVHFPGRHRTFRTVRSNCWISSFAKMSPHESRRRQSDGVRCRRAVACTLHLADRLVSKVRGQPRRIREGGAPPHRYSALSRSGSRTRWGSIESGGIPAEDSTL